MVNSPSPSVMVSPSLAAAIAATSSSLVLTTLLATGSTASPSSCGSAESFPFTESVGSAPPSAPVVSSAVPLPLLPPTCWSPVTPLSLLSPTCKSSVLPLLLLSSDTPVPFSETLAPWVSTPSAIAAYAAVGSRDSIITSESSNDAALLPILVLFMFPHPFM